jgi:hypothetical protein
LLIQTLSILLGSLLLGIFFDQNSGYSFAIGGVIVLINISVIWICWRFLIQKKLVALALLIIVFKYAILAIILYKIVNLAWAQPLWLGLGFGTLMLAAVISATTTNKEI